MPDRRTHRGAHPHDAELFADEQRPQLRAAVDDLSWLLSRGYSNRSALKLVGDRYALRERQRVAVLRCSCSTACVEDRLRRQVVPEDLAAQTVLIDGFNILMTTESLLGGGVVLGGRDGCLRDLAGVHGTYRKVHETAPALELIGGWLVQHRVARACWYLDQPVSNSGRLKQQILQTAQTHAWNWSAELVPSPDRTLRTGAGIVASADSGVLDFCKRWVNLVRAVACARALDGRIVDLAAP